VRGARCDGRGCLRGRVTGGAGRGGAGRDGGVRGGMCGHGALLYSGQ